MVVRKWEPWLRISGENVYPMVSMLNGSLNYSVASGVSIAKTEKSFQIAQTQIHQTYMGRESVIQEATLAEFKTNPSAGREMTQK